MHEKARFLGGASMAATVLERVYAAVLGRCPTRLRVGPPAHA